MSGVTSPVDSAQNGPDVESPSEESESPQEADPRIRSRPGPLTALAVLIIVLAMISGWLGLRLRDLSATQSDRMNAAAAAQRLAISLTTISATSSEQNIEQLLNSTTGSLKDQIAQSSSSLSQILKSNGVTSVGSTVQIGVTSLSDAKASVLVATDASVTSAKGTAVQRHYRMRASLTKVGERWLVSDMEFVP